MSRESVRVRGTASVANVSCGFDCIGYALDAPADILTISAVERSGIEISISGPGSDTIPTSAEQNTAGAAALSLLEALGSHHGFTIHIEKGIPPGSGIGSSAASAVAAVIGINRLLGEPLSREDLVVHAMAGEVAAAGMPHADNVAPALLGGMLLIASQNPLDIVDIPLPDGLWSTVVLPQMTISTRAAREVLPPTVPLEDAVRQAGNLAGFTLGLATDDLALVSRSMVDLFAEPVRCTLIPGFDGTRSAAMDAGALGCGISGSGPSLFALSDSGEVARDVGLAMIAAFAEVGLASRSYHSPIRMSPAEILD